MRTRRSRKKYTLIKKTALLMCSLAAFPALVHFMLTKLPGVTAAAQKIAVLSAGFSMPEGSAAAFKSEASVNPADEQTESALNEIFASKADKASSSPVSSEKPQTKTAVKPKNAGRINRITFGNGSAPTYISLPGGASIKNCTSLPYEKIKKAAEKAPAFSITGGKKPEVLIMHTHTTEAYEPYTRDFFDPKYNSRTLDKTKNVVYVGDKIAAELLKSGVSVLHDFTVHDNPAYTGSYERSAQTVKKYLKKYPSIKVVLDVHRDAIRPDSKNRTAPVAKINGKNAAQIMIISGCDDGTMDYPHYLKNLSFSAKLASQAQKDYKGLMRPVLFDYRFYNQNLTTGSILLEMGSDSNSLEEAAYAGTLIGKSLSKVLTAMKK